MNSPSKGAEQRRVADPVIGLYILFRLLIGLSLLSWSIWRLKDSPSELSSVRIHYNIAAVAFFFMGVSAALAPRFGEKRWYLWGQMFIDAIFVSALIAASDYSQSPYFVLYCVNIIAAVRLLSPKGVMLVTGLDSLSFLFVGFIGLSGGADDGLPPLVLYTQIAFQLFGLLLVGVLSVSLSLRIEQQQSVLAEQEQRTRILKRRHKDLLDRIPLAIMTLQDDMITGQNDLARRLFGELLGTEYGETFSEKKQRWEFVWNWEGNDLLLEGRLLPLEEGGTVLILEDVSRLREIENLAAREDRLAAVGRLAASLAHEIRNPLASLSGAVQMLAENDKTRLHEIALRESSRLNGLVEDFLRFSRPPKLQKIFTSPEEIIDEVIDALRLDPRCEDVDLVVKLARPCPMLHIDPRHSRQVLLNLIINAVQSTSRGSITLEDQEEDDWWKVSVADNGTGIAKEQLPRIFDPFYTTRSGGTGLGLANVERIVRGHNGRISVQSEEGVGSRFVIELPVPRR